MKKFLVLFFAGLLMASAASAALEAYSQDFEGLDQADPGALSNDGWLVFGNVFGAGDGNYWYGYGPFPAPNGGPAFSAIAAGEGGVDQGSQQLVAYSDYNNGDHGNGGLIEANVFRELVIDAADIGSTWTFSFDVKHGDLVPESTSLAFIKTLNPNAGWAMTNFLTVDTHTLPPIWGSDSISINIDPSLQGQILQFGFSSKATAYTPSGMIYDNISFVPEPMTLGLLGLGGLFIRRRRKA